MGNWFFKLEIDDENGLPLTIDSKNRGVKLVLRERNEHVLEFDVRDLAMDSRIVRGKRCRIFGDHNVNPPTIKQFEGIMTDKNERGTWNKKLHVLARDFFKDRLLTRTVNKKYTQQKAGIIFKDIVQTFLGSEFTVNSVQDTSVTISEEFPHFQGELAADILAEDTLTEYFCKANLDCVFRAVRSDDSGLTITESMVRDVTEVKRTLAESCAEVIVVGGLDASNNRVIARAIDTTLPAEIQGRKYPHHDKRYTTYQGAKLKALSILSALGRDFINIPPVFIKDLTALPRPGQFVTLNIPSHSLNNVKVLVRQIEINMPEGEESIQWLKFWFGETEKTYEERILIHEAAFEKERARGTLQAEIATQQLLNTKDTLTVTEVKQFKKCSNFYYDSVPGGDPDGCLAAYDNTKGNQTEYDV